MLEEEGFWFTYKRLCYVNKCALCTEGVTPHNFAYVRSKPIVASLRVVPVDSLFVVNTLENIQFFIRSVTIDYSANSTLTTVKFIKNEYQHQNNIYNQFQY